MGAKNEVGNRYGRLVVQSRAGSTAKWQALWNCQCDCGNTIVVLGYNLRSGNSKSCGCYNPERSTTHGMVNSPEYKSWAMMKDRCTNPNNPRYANYGGRGITFDKAFETFEGFFAELGPKPDPTYTIERIDNNKGYEPGNVRWATRAEQNRNKSNNWFLTHNGKTQTLSEWAREVGIKEVTLDARLRRYGWSVERALTTPVKKNS